MGSYAGPNKIWFFIYSKSINQETVLEKFKFHMISENFQKNFLNLNSFKFRPNLLSFSKNGLLQNN